MANSRCGIAYWPSPSYILGRPSFATTRYSLLATRYSLLATRYSLLATRYSLLATRYSLLATRYSLLAPHLLRHLNDAAQLRPLLVLGQQIALLGRGKAALAGDAELLERGVFRRLLDAALELVRAFELA